MATIGPETWAVLIILGGVLVVVNLVVQYGITFVSANAAIALFLFELVVAALSSWWLAGGRGDGREGVGRWRDDHRGKFVFGASGAGAARR